MKKLSKITLRILISSITFGILLCSVISISGYRQFTSKFRSTYYSNLMSISKTALAEIEPLHIENYVLNEADDEYNRVYKVLNDITENFDLNFIYVSIVSGDDYSHIVYIFDTVKPGSSWKPYPRGYTEDYFEESYNKSARKVYETGESVVRYTRKAKTGSHITCIVPVKNEADKVVAILGVEKSTQEYVNELHSYLNKSVIISFLITVLLVLLLIFFSKRQIINPLLQISEETLRFKKIQTLKEGWNSSIRTKDEISDLADQISDMEKEILNYVDNLTKVTAEKERITTELNIARDIQAAMLPTDFSSVTKKKRIGLFATMMPAKEVGGDFYDYLMVDDDHLLMVIGDVSGKGIPASLFMVVTKTLIQTRALENLSPSEIAGKVNRALCQNNKMSMFVTVWLGIYTLSTGELKFINAAHPYPVLYRAQDKSCQFIETKPNLMLGGLDSSEYEEHSINLKSGDRLFVYTDGVTEAKGSSEELFGQERTLQTVTQALSTDGITEKERVELILKSINEFVDDAPQFDDITMLQFEVK